MSIKKNYKLQTTLLSIMQAIVEKLAYSFFK